ncbi:MAG TPA: hypothetical protein VE130_10485 [Nitrososphaeraceae archaeon]|nr:hypothetical protein [Nitrososphaeraceae archaeon]
MVTYRGILMWATFTVVTATLAATMFASSVGTSTPAPAFAQDQNMTGGAGNVTEGNMTSSNTTGGGMGTLPPPTNP